MKTKFCLLYCFILVIPLYVYAQSQFQNTISGFVFDASTRQPIPDIYVELVNESYYTIKRIKTDSSGRYFFSGMASGNFKIKVNGYSSNYLEEIQDVTVYGSGLGSAIRADNSYLDIYLRLDRRKINLESSSVNGILFAQNIPDTAKKLYEKGAKQLKNSKEGEEGFSNLQQAVKIFPTYYDALNTTGIGYIKRGRFSEAVPFLIKAIEVNQRSFSGFYALGLAAYYLRRLDEASEAFRAATIINPQSIHAQLQYGRVSRIKGNYILAEQILLKAKNLDKNSEFGEIHWQLGLLYNTTGRYTEAASELEKFIKIENDLSNLDQIRKLIIQLRAKGSK